MSPGNDDETAERYVLAKDAKGLRQFLQKDGNKEQVHGTIITKTQNFPLLHQRDTFLYHAIREGDLELFKVLLDYGAEPRVRNRGFNAKEAAAFYDRLEILEILNGGTLDKGTLKVIHLRGCVALRKGKGSEARRLLFFDGTETDGTNNKTVCDLLIEYFATINKGQFEKAGRDSLCYIDAWCEAVWAVEFLFTRTTWGDFIPRIQTSTANALDYYVISRYVTKVKMTNVRQGIDLLNKINGYIKEKKDLSTFDVCTLLSTFAQVLVLVVRANVEDPKIINSLNLLSLVTYHFKFSEYILDKKYKYLPYCPSKYTAFYMLFPRRMLPKEIHPCHTLLIEGIAIPWPWKHAVVLLPPSKNPIAALPVPKSVEQQKKD